MRILKYLEVFFFLLGFFIGFLINSCLKFKEPKKLPQISKNHSIIIDNLTTLQPPQKLSKYDSRTADELFWSIRIVCLILTQPKDHETKAQFVKDTWGNKCNKLIFLSSVEDKKLGAIALPLNESRNVLWGKVKRGFEFAFEELYDDADWFLKADDDSYVRIF